MKYDPVKAEKDWRQPVKFRKPITGERHNLPHNLVRIAFANIVRSLGCNKDSLILDIGCGSGEDAQYVSGVSKNITGIDVSEAAIKSFTAKGYKGIVADANNLPFKNESFDFVLCPAILHHLVGQGSLTPYFSEFTRVLKINGYLAALEPNAFNVSGVLMNIANALRPGITGLVPHERALSPLAIMMSFSDAGLSDITCSAASFTWNRLPLFLTRFVAKYEEPFKTKSPFRYLGWFTIITGRKTNKEEHGRKL